MRFPVIVGLAAISLVYGAQSDKDRIADLTRQNFELSQQLKAETAQNQANMAKLSAQITARAKDADAINRAAASGRSEAKAAAVDQSDAIATVQQSTENLQLQIALIPLRIAELKPASPFSSVMFWTALFVLIGTFLGSCVTVALAVVGHSKLSVVSANVNGINEKMGAAREQKGHDAGVAEGREEGRNEAKAEDQAER